MNKRANVNARIWNALLVAIAVVPMVVLLGGCLDLDQGSSSGAGVDETETPGGTAAAAKATDAAAHPTSTAIPAVACGSAEVCQTVQAVNAALRQPGQGLGAELKPATVSCTEPSPHDGIARACAARAGGGEVTGLKLMSKGGLDWVDQASFVDQMTTIAGRLESPVVRAIGCPATDEGAVVTECAADFALAIGKQGDIAGSPLVLVFEGGAIVGAELPSASTEKALRGGSVNHGWVDAETRSGTYNYYWYTPIR